MLCKFCTSLDFDQASTFEGAPHHASMSDLKASALKGCELCQMIREEWDRKSYSAHVVDTQDDTQIRCNYNDAGQALSWKQGDRKNIVPWVLIAWLDIWTRKGQSYVPSFSLEPTCLSKTLGRRSAFKIDSY
jgi:hypothetical protein